MTIMEDPDVPPRRRSSHHDEPPGLDAFHRFYVAAVPSLYLPLRRLGLTGDVLQETMYLMLTYDRKIESPWPSRDGSRSTRHTGFSSATPASPRLTPPAPIPYGPKRWMTRSPSARPG